MGFAGYEHCARFSSISINPSHSGYDLPPGECPRRRVVNRKPPEVGHRDRTVPFPGGSIHYGRAVLTPEVETGRPSVEAELTREAGADNQRVPPADGPVAVRGITRNRSQPNGSDQRHDASDQQPLRVTSCRHLPSLPYPWSISATNLLCVAKFSDTKRDSSSEVITISPTHPSMQGCGGAWLRVESHAGAGGCDSRSEKDLGHSPQDLPGTMRYHWNILGGLS